MVALDLGKLNCLYTITAFTSSYMLFFGFRTLFDSVTRGYGDHSPLTRPEEKVTYEEDVGDGAYVGGLEVDSPRLSPAGLGLGRGPLY